MVRVLTAGHVNWDVTLRVDRLPEPDGESRIDSQQASGGGSAANVAVALSHLDVDAELLGSVGDDEHGLLARRELEAADVDLDSLLVAEAAETTVKYLLVDEAGEVAVLGNDGANEAVAPDDVDPEAVRAADHVHLTSQRPDTAARIAEVAAEAGVTVSFDPGRRLADRDFSAALADSDIVFLNDKEAKTVLENEYTESAFADRTLVIKRGAAGAVVHTPDASYEHPGFGIDPVDTTGAGDAFAAGFLSALLTTDDYERALERGNACGAITAAEEGARAAPTTEEVEAFLDEQF
ncbi:carbohydrate kinase family protein [Haloarchaeobius sp. HME9146]|uniref:carbohydrate kinase family protein n=1 Tax=Haloarchaeobius sp. HME9146 TaxID=2978732 RepID=UPI0021BEBAF6|nr:carbohydrate kinase family protein [Haloarchaeobius sp. HME9146]MCT9097757.1 carbohydrate kinase family protein [Haloarchaeobius sp. HME9146]